MSNHEMIPADELRAYVADELDRLDGLGSNHAAVTASRAALSALLDKFTGPIPAACSEGEAWLIKIDGGDEVPAIKVADGDWAALDPGDTTVNYHDGDDIKLVSRLAPKPDTPPMAELPAPDETPWVSGGTAWRLPNVDVVAEDEKVRLLKEFASIRLSPDEALDVALALAAAADHVENSGTAGADKIIRAERDLRLAQEDAAREEAETEDGRRYLIRMKDGATFDRTKRYRDDDGDLWEWDSEQNCWRAVLPSGYVIANPIPSPDYGPYFEEIDKRAVTLVELVPVPEGAQFDRARTYRDADGTRWTWSPFCGNWHSEDQADDLQCVSDLSKLDGPIVMEVRK